MIAAKCPECSGRFQFASENLGKKVRCPFCKKVTVIHAPTTATTPSPAPPPPPVAPPPKVAPPPPKVAMTAAKCPACASRFQFASENLGKKVRCPTCKEVTVFRAPNTATTRSPVVPPPKVTPLPQAPPQAVRVQPAPVTSPPPVAVPPRLPQQERRSNPAIKWALWASAVLIPVLLAATLFWMRGPDPATEADTGQQKDQAQTDSPKLAGRRPGGSSKPLPPEQWHTAVDTSLPRVVVQLDSWDGLMEDLRTLLSEVGQENVLDQNLTMLARQHPDGLTTFPGLDPTKPMGAYLSTDGVGSATVVLVVPVRNREHFVALLRGMSEGVRQAGQDTVVVDNLALFQKQVTVRFAHGQAYFTLGEVDLAQAELVSPEKLFANDRDPATFSATFHIDRIPVETRKIALAQPLQALTSVRPQMPLQFDGESLSRSIVVQGQPLEMPSASFKQIQEAYLDKVLELLTNTAADLFKGGESVSLRLDVDRRRKRLLVDLALSGRPDSRLAANIESVGQRPSQFGYLYDKPAAFKCFLHASLPDALKSRLPDLVDAVTESTLAQAENPTEGEAYKELMEALGKTFAAGEADLAAMLFRTGPNGETTGVGAFKLADGLGFANAFKSKMETLGEDDRKLWDFDAGTRDRTLYQMKIDDNASPEWRMLFGDFPFNYGFSKKAMVVTLGESGKTFAMETLNLEPLSPGERLPSFLLELNVRRLLDLRPFATPQAQAARQILTEEHPGSVRLSVQGGDALKASLVLDLTLFRVVAQQAAVVPDLPGQ